MPFGSPAPDAVRSGVAAIEGDVIIGKVPTGIDADVPETVALVPDYVVETSAGVGDVKEATTRKPDESDMVSIPDTVMSIGGSSSEGSPCRSTCGSSASATGSRKRAADESPDRKVVRNTRRDFPGRIMRSAAGCRVYVPPIWDDKAESPGSILNDDGTIWMTETVQPECGIVIEGEAGDIVLNNASKLTMDTRDPLDSASARPEAPNQTTTVLPTFTDTPPTDLVIELTDNVRP